MYLVVTQFIQQTSILSTSVSDIFENEADAWSYVGQQIDELSKKDKNPTIFINLFRKESVVSIGALGSNYPHPTSSIFIFSIHETHISKIASNKN